MSGMDAKELKKELEKLFDFLAEKKLLPEHAIRNKKEMIDLIADAIKAANPSLDKNDLAKPEMKKTVMITMLAVAKHPELATLDSNGRGNQKNNDEVKQLTHNLLRLLYEALNKLSPKPLDDKQLEAKIERDLNMLCKKLDTDAPDEDPRKQQAFAMTLVAAATAFSAAILTRERMYGTKQGVDNLEDVDLAKFTAQASATSTDSLISVLTTYDTRDANHTTANDTEADILDNLSGPFAELEESLNDLGKIEHAAPRPQPPGTPR